MGRRGADARSRGSLSSRPHMPSRCSRPAGYQFRAPLSDPIQVIPRIRGSFQRQARSARRDKRHSSLVISTIVRRNPSRSNNCCARRFGSAVHSITRGAPRLFSQPRAASISAVATPDRRASPLTTMSWTKPAASRSSFHDCGSRPGVDVADREPVQLGDENRNLVVMDLRAEKPRVARLRVDARVHEPERIEGDVHAHQLCAEAAQRGKVGFDGAANGEIGHGPLDRTLAWDPVSRPRRRDGCRCRRCRAAPVAIGAVRAVQLQRGRVGRRGRRRPSRRCRPRARCVPVVGT